LTIPFISILVQICSDLYLACWRRWAGLAPQNLLHERAEITEANLTFAFHHFDVQNSGYITEQNLEECFRREGKHLTHEEIQAMLSQVQTATPGRITYSEFRTFMQEILWSESSPTAPARQV
jgi:hypothetical protein